MRDAMRMMRRRSAISMGRRSNRPSMLLRRRRMARSRILARPQSCGKVTTYLSCILYGGTDSEDVGLGIIIEMVLDYNLTLSNDTVVMYVTGHLVPSRIMLMMMFIAGCGEHLLTRPTSRLKVSALSTQPPTRSTSCVEPPYHFPADLTSPPLDGTGLRRWKHVGKLPHREQLVRSV